jgi:hypothetical protein
MVIPYIMIKTLEACYSPGMQVGYWDLLDHDNPYQHEHHLCPLPLPPPRGPAAYNCLCMNYPQCLYSQG